MLEVFLIYMFCAWYASPLSPDLCREMPYHLLKKIY